MSKATRLTEIMQSARTIRLTDSSKFIFFSDCHRGDNSWADDFSDNQNLFYYALRYYNSHGFTYVEVGDGDELWENRQLDDICREHEPIFALMKEFYNPDPDKNRLHLIRGNHDIQRKDRKYVEETLWRPFYSAREHKEVPLLPHIQVHEGLVLEYRSAENEPADGKLLVVHGHQGEVFNDLLWPCGRFLVRHLWRHLQLLGIHDPTSPAQSSSRCTKVDKLLREWAEANYPLIAGHTHRAWFPKPGDSPCYFNDGSCVHPRCITGIEIQEGNIQLIKWSITPRTDPPPDLPEDMLLLAVSRHMLEGPMALKDVFSKCCTKREKP